VEVTGVTYWVRVRETRICSIKIEKDASANILKWPDENENEENMNYVNDVVEVEDSTFEIKVAKDDGKTEDKANETDSTIAMGHYWGIVSMWDTAVFVKSHIYCGVNYVVVAGKWMGVQGVCHVINVYAPQTLESKKSLWEEISYYMQSKTGHFIVFGDFNEVRHGSERFGSVYNQQGANTFIKFINQTELVDLNIGGHNSTWMNQSGTKMSKLDSKIGAIEDKMDDMSASEEELAQLIFWLKELADIERLDGIDAAQKSKIKWKVEGDENTAFFHGLLNQRRRKQMVQGIMEHALDSNRFTQLDHHDIEMLEHPVLLRK
nr:RNA-directed DNA polymerase, eukaryota [Tanacetum cinerariifolium]